MLNSSQQISTVHEMVDGLSQFTNNLCKLRDEGVNPNNLDPRLKKPLIDLLELLNSDSKILIEITGLVLV